MSKTTAPIPIVDISAFTSGGDRESRVVARNFAANCHGTGCIGISGHGILEATLEEAFELSKKLFDLPYEDKMKAPHPAGPVPHRGYSGIGTEQGGAKTASETDDPKLKASILKASDYKESYEIGSEHNRIQYNIWLPESILPGFRQTTTDLYWILTNLADKILNIFAMSLDLTEQETEEIRNLHTGHTNQLRLLHYPEVSREMLAREDIGRLAAHTDFSTFTMLFQDEQSGLEFGDREAGEFLPAIPQEGVLYLNIGDMGQRLSNGFYPSGLHRVVIAGQNSSEVTPARYSIPFFVSPSPEGCIEPQLSLIAKHGKREFEPVRFGEYKELMARTTRIGT